MFRSPIWRARLGTLAAGLAIALLPIGVTFTTAAVPQAQAAPVPPPRPQGPCDIYAAGGTPCVAAHSTARALYASYNGPLYQVMRLSDNAVKNIGVVQPAGLPFPDPGGYADAAAQDAFCASTTCLITKVYDQSGHGNDLTQAPHGGFSGPAMGGANNLPGYGASYEQATVTAVGKPRTQGRLSAPAAAGDTNLKMSSTTNISVGDTLRLDIGPKIESVTVTSVGTSGASGTGVTIATPLQFDHASNLPYSDRGTGISFTSATTFAHSSNEPVQALGSGITLDNPLDNSHAINTPVRDALVTTAGYQGAPAPSQ